MNLSLEISGIDGLENKLLNLPDRIRQSVLESLTDSALLIHETAVKSIAAKGSGSNTVTRYSPKREQLVSEPGSPPNTDLGGLVQSIQFEVDQEELVAVVGSNLKYAVYLEFGTTTMQARPWLFPALEANKNYILDIFTTKMKTEVEAA